MALRITFITGGRAGDVIEFDDRRDRVRFGRDPDRCDVVFPEDETRVSREHCALRRVLGRYRLVLNGENPVFVDGSRGHEDDVLEESAELQLGADGPRISVETHTVSRLAETVILDVDKTLGRHTMRQRMRRSVRLNWMLTLLTTVIVIAAAWFVTSEFTRQRRRVDDVDEKLETTKVEVSTLSERERASMAKLLDRIDERDPIRVFKQQIANVEPSVYLVLVRNANKSYDAQGTAWVVGPGALATNAHVARKFDSLKPGQRLIVRSSSTPPVDHAVTKVRIHAGFGRFLQALANHRPIDAETGEPAKLIPACDVALMSVTEPAKLAAPLRLAPASALLELGAGDRVGFVGYPLEGVRLSDVSRPQPSSQIGHITSLTDVFTAKTTPERRHLVMHNLPVTGGVSGSPLFDHNGAVVAVVSAGSFHVIADPSTGKLRRIPIAVGVNFAQRADLVRELLDDTVTDLQAKRDVFWARELTRFRSGRLKPAEIVARMKSYLEAYQRRLGRATKRVEPVLEKRGTIDKGGAAHGVAIEVTLPTAAAYLITAVADDVRDIDVAVLSGARVVAKDDTPDHFPSVIRRFGANARVRILVYLKPGAGGKTPFTLYLFRAIP